MVLELQRGAWLDDAAEEAVMLVVHGSDAGCCDAAGAGFSLGFSLGSSVGTRLECGEGEHCHGDTTTSSGVLQSGVVWCLSLKHI